MRHLFYFAKEAVRGLLQAKLMTSLSILIIGVSLFFFGAVGLTALNFQNWFSRASSQLRLIAYVEEDIAQQPAKLNALVDGIRARNDVAEVSVVDKDEAWRRFEESYGKEMLEAVNENPFPYALEIVPSDEHSGGENSSLVEALESDPALLGISYLRDWLDRINQIKDFFLLGALVVFVLVTGALTMVISNTVKLTIYARRELVSNMRLVGATNLYIEMPFVLEGMLQGFMGGVVAVAVLFSARVLLSRFAFDWGPISLLWIPPGIGMFFGWLGSINAVRKFLT